jgi:hypothetical protein
MRSTRGRDQEKGEHQDELNIKDYTADMPGPAIKRTANGTIGHVMLSRCLDRFFMCSAIGTSIHMAIAINI